jgi:hypothetical protein
MASNDDIVQRALGEVPHCMWQITPSELPKGLRPMALELHRTADGALHLFQLFARTRGDGWWRDMEGYVHYTGPAPARPVADAILEGLGQRKAADPAHPSPTEGLETALEGVEELVSPEGS